MDEWLTIQEAMQRLKASRATLYRWAKDGRLTIHQLALGALVSGEKISSAWKKKPRGSTMRKCEVRLPRYGERTRLVCAPSSPWSCR
jgi:excisionase family DNA binding protein